MITAYRTIAGNRNLLRLFFGEFVSGIGDWLYLVALLVIVYRESADPFLLGVIGGARIIPYVLLSVPAGVVVDRYDRRLVLIVTDIIRGLAMIGLAVNTFLDGPVLLTVGLAIFATCFAVFFRPSMGAYLPSLVRNEAELGPANSVHATLGEVTFIIGPAIAGLIIAATDLGCGRCRPTTRARTRRPRPRRPLRRQRPRGPTARPSRRPSPPSRPAPRLAASSGPWPA
jgi:DHA3 family macrolide efflux protein-like MFS transporter